MANRRRPAARGGVGGAPLGLEETLWRAAEELRGHVEPAEYKHLVLGLLFLKHVTSSGPPDRGAAPEATGWPALVAAARSGRAAAALSAAIQAIEAAHPQLSGLLGFDARRIHPERLGALVAALDGVELGGAEDDPRDVLGRVYEYFLAKFASSEGRSGGEYYTPRAVVRLLVEMIQPFSGTIYDPCCGTAGMFVQSQRLLVEHGGRAGDVAIFGQESSPTTWRLARMNLALRGIRADLGPSHADTFRADAHPGLRADFILANPPFNARGWGADELAGDPRFRFGAPPPANANYAWIQHILAHLAPQGVAGLVLANGSLSSDQSGEARLRQRMVDADVVECIVTLPGQLFYGTQIPACIWIVSPAKTRGGAEGLETRTLFVDARARGHLVDRSHADLSAGDIADIAGAYHRFRAEGAQFRDVPGFARAASIDEIRRHRYALVPGRYVGFAEERRPAFDPAALAVEMDEARARIAAVEAASRRFLAKMGALRRG